MKYFDAHCHVQFDPYDADRVDVLNRMIVHEVGGMVVGLALDSSVLNLPWSVRPAPPMMILTIVAGCFFAINSGMYL